MEFLQARYIYLIMVAVSAYTAMGVTLYEYYRMVPKGQEIVGAPGMVVQVVSIIDCSRR